MKPMSSNRATNDLNHRQFGCTVLLANVDLQNDPEKCEEEMKLVSSSLRVL